MNARLKPSHTQKAPPRLALITPSASPPSSRSLSLLGSRLSIDRPPPAKRARLASTPSSPFSVSTPSSSTADLSLDIHESRRASSLRLLTTWSALAERYNRPLDEDDIIDLRDGSIIKDRGVLRSAEKKFEMGCFAGDDVPSDANDASSDGGGAHTDDDVDEFNAFAPGADISDELELEKEKRHVPPVREMDPADAEDLREFLEAEKRRKDQYGDDEEEEEEEGVVDLMSLNRATTVRNRSRLRSETDEGGGHGRQGLVPAYPDDRDDCEDLLEEPPPSSSTLASEVDEDSEDEFAAWDFNDHHSVTTPASTTPAKPTNPSRPRTPVDVIDLTQTPLSSPTRTPVVRGRSKAPVILERSEGGPSCSRSLPRGRAKLPARDMTPVRRKSSMPPPPMPLKPARQLATPPPSSSSVVEGTLDVSVSRNSSSSSSPLPPSPPRPPKPKLRPRLKGVLLKGNSPDVCSSPAVENPSRLKPVETTITTATPKSRLVPEVVITSRPPQPRLTSRARSSTTLPQTQDLGEIDVFRVEPTSPHKGKAKEVYVRRRKSVLADVDDRRAESSKHHGRSMRPQTSPGYEDSDDEEVARPPRSRKRKRVLSSSSLSGTSDKDDPFPAITPIVPTRAHRTGTPGPPSDRRTPRPKSKTTDSNDEDSDDELPAPPPLPPPRARTPRKPLPPRSESHGVPTPSSCPPRHPDSHIPYPPLMAHDPDAQERFAQAAHYLSYLMSAAASLPPPPGYPHGYPPPPPPPFLTTAPQWSPWTPVHRSHRPHRDPPADLSSDAGPSSSMSTYATPSHYHPYPFSFDPSYTRASLPPSSPPASSEPFSPIPRSSSLARGRSKSRGRRVSFKLDDGDRPPQLSDGERMEEGMPSSSHTNQTRAADHGGRANGPRKGKNKAPVQDGGAPTKPDKGRSKARANQTAGSGESDSDRGGRTERGRTPGPPSHQERSVSVRAHGRRT